MYNKELKQFEAKIYQQFYTMDVQTTARESQRYQFFPPLNNSPYFMSEIFRCNKDFYSEIVVANGFQAKMLDIPASVVFYFFSVRLSSKELFQENLNDIGILYFLPKGLFTVFTCDFVLLFLILLYLSFEHVCLDKICIYEIC